MLDGAFLKLGTSSLFLKKISPERDIKFFFKVRLLFQIIINNSVNQWHVIERWHAKCKDNKITKARL